MTLLKLYIIIITFFPLIGSLSVGILNNLKKKKYINIIIISNMFISFIFTCKLLNLYILNKYYIFEDCIYTFGYILNLKLEIGFLIDRLTILMLFIVIFISLLVHIYTIEYMKTDKGYNRFFSYISFFTFAMIALVISNNFLQLFFGWEAVGLASYLLIGFWFEKQSAIHANMKAFIVNRIGDLGFLIGIAAILYNFETLNYYEIFYKLFNQKIEQNTITFISISLFLGAMGKSAQIPLHVWLPDSMEGPTPISALIHAATMVTAGIFMISRLSPIIELSDVALICILTIGTLTCLLMGILALIQNDIKRIIAYSTLSQLGLMMMAIGVSAYTSSIYHLFTHAFFKALLFLCAGSIIISLHHEQDIKNMGFLKKYLPITYITMLLGSLSLSGFPLFSGFFSKDLITISIKFSNFKFSYYIYIILLLSIFITSLYTFRMFFKIFHGKKKKYLSKIKECNLILTMPLIILSIFSTIIGWITFNYIISDFFYDNIFINKNIISNKLLLKDLINNKELLYHSFKEPVLYISISGIIISYIISLTNISIFSFIKKKNFIIYNLLINHYYFDKIYIYIANIILITSNIMWKKIDNNIIDTKMVKSIPNMIKNTSKILKKKQQGNIYHYIHIILILCSIFLFIMKNNTNLW